MKPFFAHSAHKILSSGCPVGEIKIGVPHHIGHRVLLEGHSHGDYLRNVQYLGLVGAGGAGSEISLIM